MKTLKELKSGETATIRAWVCYDRMLSRLNAMGLGIGNQIEVLSNRWLQPIHLRAGMTEMFIRKTDAKNVWVDLND